MGDIENPMILDSHWRHQEQPEPKVIGECAGCQEDIAANQDWYEMVQVTTNGEQVLVHQSDDCCRQYVADMSYCRGQVD
jgi:hypothetical protein